MSKEKEVELGGWDYFVAEDGDGLYLVEGYMNEKKDIVMVSSGRYLGSKKDDGLDMILLDLFWQKKALEDTIAGTRPLLNIHKYQNYDRPERLDDNGSSSVSAG